MIRIDYNSAFYCNKYFELVCLFVQNTFKLIINKNKIPLKAINYGQ